MNADYKDADGLLHCGKCGGYKQKRLPNIPGAPDVVNVMCACEAIERKMHVMAMRETWQISPQDDGYFAITFAQDDGSDPKTGGIVRRYVEKREEIQAKNIGLLFHGGVGGGKTYWAACIANALIDAGTTATITTVPAIIKAMQANYERDKERILEKIARVQFLVLDDVGFERATPYAHEKLYEIINARYLARRPLIVTTNLTLEEIKAPPSMEYKRPFDRIVEMCTPLYISAEGRRQAIARDKSDAARNILGL